MNQIPQDTIDQIRDSSEILDVVSDYVELRRRGRNYFGLCPFHPEKTPSFSVAPDKQIYHCFGCGAGGNVRQGDGGGGGNGCEEYKYIAK